MVAIAVTDYYLFGLSRSFYGLLAVRLTLVSYGIWLIKSLPRLTNYQSYDRAEFLWGLCIATFVISVAATRPTAFIAHIIVVVLAVLLTVLAVPNRFTNQLTMSLVYIIGETLILAHSLWTSPPTYTTALFLLFLANSIAVASGWMLHSYRRKEFLAQELEQKARAEAEIQLAERKRVEEQLWITLERIKDGFFACDAEWRFLYVNAQAERILGICREEVLGKSHWEVFPLTLGTNIESEYRLAAAGEMRNFENFYEPWSHWFHNRCFPREGGGMSVYFEDITERKQAEKEREQLLGIIQQKKDRVVSLIDNITDEIWFADFQKNFTLVNPSGRGEFGMRDDEEIKVEKFVSNLDIYRPDGSLRPIEESPALRALRGEIVTGHEHIVRIPPNGELRHQQINSSPVRDPKGNIIGSISVVWDITEIKKTEMLLRVSEAKYRDLFETVQEVFYINRLIYDEQGNVIDWIFEDLNPAGFKLLGLKDIDEARGKRGSEVLGCEVASFYLPMIKKARQSGEAVLFQYHSPYVDKEFLSSYVVHGDRHIAAQMDSTEQKK